MARRRAFGTVTKRKGRGGYYCLWTWRGQRFRRYGGSAFGAAERKLARVQTLLEGGSDLDTVLSDVFGEITGARSSMRDLADCFLDSRSRQRRETTVKNDRQRLARILSSGSWTAKPMGLVRPEEIEKWAAKRLDGGLVGPTVNRELSILSRFFDWARQRGFVKSNPVREIPRYSEVGRGRIDFLAPKECRLLLEAAEEEGQVFRAYLTTMMLTGARRMELAQLRWKDVDFRGREVVIPREADKIAQGRAIPMAPDLVETLDSLWKARKVVTVGKVASIGRGAPVFPQEDGTLFTPKVLSSMLERTRGRSRLPEDRKKVVGFHVLRHTAASLLRKAGVDLADVGRILGHRCLQTTLRYAHLYADGTRDGVNRLGKVLGLRKCGTKSRNQEA